MEETNRPLHLPEKGLDRASKSGKVCQGIHMHGPVLSIKTACCGIMFLRTWEAEADPDSCNSSCCYCQIVKSEFKNCANRKRINHGKKFRFVNYIQ